MSRWRNGSRDDIASRTPHVHRPGTRTTPGQPYLCAVCGVTLTYHSDDGSWQPATGSDWRPGGPSGWRLAGWAVLLVLAVLAIWIIRQQGVTQ